MPLRPLSTLKTWFETGDKPTQAHFWDWLDSFWHKDDAIPQSSVSGLSSALNGKADAAAVEDLTPVVMSGSSPTASHSMGGGKILHKVRVKGDADMTALKVGTTVGGSEILPDEALSAGTAAIYTLDFDLESPTTIYFSGLTGTWSIKIIFQ